MNGNGSATWSLRLRLFGLLSGVVLLIWLLGGLILYFEARNQSDELADRSLSETALLLLSLAEHEILEHGGPFSEIVSPASQMQADHLVFQIWNGEGRIMYRSIGSIADPLVPLASVGYAERFFGGQPWRVFSMWDDEHALQIQVAETMAHRRNTGLAVFSEFGLYGAFLIPLSLILIWVITARVFGPLDRSAADVAARSPDDLRPVSVAGAPREVAPLLRSLNQLLDRVRAAFERERTFTADAAHELRTPLAAIRTTAQVLGETRDPEALRASVQDLVAGVDRSARLVDQLLVMARMDARSGGEMTDVDLAQLVTDECAAQRKHAASRGVRVDLATANVIVRGDAARLAILLRNLADNAVRYTPLGGRVLLACREGRDGAELVVSDSGVGIPEEARSRIFERFFRVLGNDAAGSGLGLSIVRRIAEDHAATIGLGEGLDGCGVTFVVRFPPGPDQSSTDASAARSS